MKRGTFVLGLALLAQPSLTLLAQPVRAGSEITLETRQAGPEAKPLVSLVEVEGRSLRAESGDGRRGAIWRGAEGVLEVLDHRKRSVVRIDRGTARSLAGGVDGVRGGVAQLPAAQREVVEGWLGSGASPELELRAKNQRAEVSGVACRLFDALRDGARLAEVCEGPLGAAGVTGEALAPARELAAFLAEFGGVLPPSLGADGLEALVLVRQVEGVPLRVRVWPKDAVATEARIVRAVPKPIAANRFETPPGYEAGLGIHVRDPQ